MTVCQPTPTDQLIQQLDSDVYAERVIAHDTLFSLDTQVLYDLERHSNNKSAEIRRSCRQLLVELLYVEPDDTRYEYPDISYMLDEHRYCLGEDMAEIYRKEAEEVHKRATPVMMWVPSFGAYIPLEDMFKRRENIGRLATRLFIIDQRYSGVSIKDCKEILRRMQAAHLALMYRGPVEDSHKILLERPKGIMRTTLVKPVSTF